MPLYDWFCQNCGTEFETIAAFGVTTVPCPVCVDAGLVKKKISFPAGYKINGDNSCSTPRKQYANTQELDRRAAKRDRMENYYRKGHWG